MWSLRNVPIVLALMLIPVAGTAEAQGLGERRLALARELFEIVGASNRGDQVQTAVSRSVATSYQMLYQQIAAGIRDEAARVKFIGRFDQELARFGEAFTSALDDRIDLQDLVVESFVPAYADLYTEAELEQLLKFYRSPLGQKVINGQPERLRSAVKSMMVKLSPILQDLMRSAIPEERDRLIALAGASR